MPEFLKNSIKITVPCILIRIQIQWEKKNLDLLFILKYQVFFAISN